MPLINIYYHWTIYYTYLCLCSPVWNRGTKQDVPWQKPFHRKVRLLSSFLESVSTWLKGTPIVYCLPS